MTAPSDENDDIPGYLEIAERWLVDFFAPRSTGESAALLRIGFGLLAMWTSVGVWLNLDRYYADTGLAPWSIVASDPWVHLSAFALAPDARWMLLAHAVLFTAASVLYTVGLFSRAAGAVLAYVTLSLEARNPFVLNSGDRLFFIVGVLALFAPLDRRFSLRAWWRSRSGRPLVSEGSVFGLRLIQLEIAYVYATSFISKMSNERWREGLAMRDVLASPVFSEWPRYWGFPVAAALSYVTLAFEGVFPFFVWFKRWRPWLLVCGIAFHVGIDVLMIIPMFSWMMIVSYPAFLTDEESRTVVSSVSRLFRRRRNRAPS